MTSAPLAVVDDHHRLDVLDGWRGISILLVLATHLMPVGPKAWDLNSTTGLMGMSIFFTLSGFLITSFLLKHDSVLDFLIRRFFRIVPLAWLFLVVALLYVGASGEQFVAHYLFYANIPPFHITKVTSHFWSLCMEVQFYVGIAVLFRLLGVRGLMLLPLMAIGVTVLRVATGAHFSIVTWLRIDEILAGCTLALAMNGRFGVRPAQVMERLNPYVLLALLVLSSHTIGGFMNYFRPYIAATLVGVTIVRPELWLSRRLLAKPLKYIAEISYALYVIHPLLADTWLGSGSGWEKYIKRPLLFAAVFGLAHLSTFQLEHRCIAFGKKLSKALRSKRAASPA
jgi:peptidoglycan/LPS O-acetylase OafA/YrhL